MSTQPIYVELYCYTCQKVITNPTCHKRQHGTSHDLRTRPKATK